MQLTLPRNREEAMDVVKANACAYCRDDVQFIEVEDGFFIGVPQDCPRDPPCAIRILILIRVLKSQEWEH